MTKFNLEYKGNVLVCGGARLGVVYGRPPFCFFRNLLIDEYGEVDTYCEARSRLIQSVIDSLKMISENLTVTIVEAPKDFRPECLEDIARG